MRESSHRRDLISGASLLLLATIYYLAARELPPGQSEPGPAFLPKLLALTLAILSIVIAVNGWRRRNATAHPTPSPTNLFRPMLTVLWTGLFAATLSTVGLIPSTFLYTLLMSKTLGATGRRSTILIPVVSTVVVYLLFDWGFDLMLPPPFWAS